MYISIKCRFLKSEMFLFCVPRYLCTITWRPSTVPGTRVLWLISALQILKHSCVIIKDFSIHFARQESFENVGTGSKSLSTNLWICGESVDQSGLRIRMQPFLPQCGSGCGVWPQCVPIPCGSMQIWILVRLLRNKKLSFEMKNNTVKKHTYVGTKVFFKG